MTTARVLLKQKKSIYRFMRFETSEDGSLLAIVDRDPRPKGGSMAMTEDGTFVEDNFDTDKPLSSGNFSFHTTGEIHRYAGGLRKSTIHIEPLYMLSNVVVVGFI